MAVKFRDYYEVLGVPRTATADDIKRAYRRAARKHHPDLHPEADRAAASERFKEINEANEVLSDPSKRAKYDALGENWKNGQDFTPPPGSTWGGATGRAGSGGDQWQDIGDLGDFSEFFSSLFGQSPGGGRWRGGRGGRAGPMPGNDVEAELPVTLDEVLRGGKRRIQIGGRSLEVEIPSGVRDGAVLRLAGQGQPGHDGGPPGDLYLHLHVMPDSRYRIVEDDLEFDLPLWPWQAVLGAAVKIETPDGPVSLKVPPGTQNGRRLRLRGRGLPRREGGRGDLYAVVRIVIPERPTADERAGYETLKRSAAASADRPAQE